MIFLAGDAETSTTSLSVRVGSTCSTASGLAATRALKGTPLRVQMKDDEDGSYTLDRLPGSVRAKSAALKREIARTDVPWVQGVVVFWNDFDPVLLDDRNPVYLSRQPAT